MFPILRHLTWVRAVLALLLAFSLGGLTEANWPPVMALVALFAGVEVWAAASQPGAHVGPTLSQHRFALALGAIALFGLYFRLMDVGHGLGHVATDIDESRLADSVLHFFKTGQIDHSTVEHYPGLHFWLLAVSFLFTYLWALMSGVAAGIDRMPQELFVLAGRVTNAFIEAGAIVLTGLLGRAVGGRSAGLMAALVFAVAPLAVEMSTQLRNEAALTFCVVASMYLAVRSFQRPTLTSTLGAGLLAGCAMAIKYSGLFALMPPLAAALLAGRSIRTRQLALVVGGFGLALAVTNHFIWYDFANFISQLATEVAMTGVSHWAAMENPRWFYVETLADWAVGWPLLLGATATATYGLATGNRLSWLVLSFAVAYVWFMTKQPAQFARWVYPLIPVVAVGGALAVNAAARWLVRKHEGGSGAPLYRMAAIAVVLLGMVPPVWMGARQFSRRLSPPTDARAEAWLAGQVTPDDQILSEYKWLDLSHVHARVKRVPGLPRVLASGDYEIAANDWVVVPEIYFGDPNLDRLTLWQQFPADQGFGGNRGIDFRIYRPKPVPLLPAVNVELGTPESWRFLGSAWSRDPSSDPGRDLPHDGADLFVPSPPGTDVRFRVALATSVLVADADPPPMRVLIEGQEIEMMMQVTSPKRVELTSVPLPASALRSRIVQIRLEATDRTAGVIRVLRFACRADTPRQ